jgi:hypothetical protein
MFTVNELVFIPMFQIVGTIIDFKRNKYVIKVDEGSYIRCTADIIEKIIIGKPNNDESKQYQKVAGTV